VVGQNLRLIWLRDKAESKGLEPPCEFPRTFRFQGGDNSRSVNSQYNWLLIQPLSHVQFLRCGGTAQPYWTHIVLQRVYRETTPAVTLYE
jgi:hypothetical protein